MAVYFIQAGEGGPVKIGFTSYPQKRLAALQTAHYQVLSLIREVPGGSDVEAYFHRRFAARRLAGEWFAFDADMLTASAAPSFGPRAREIGSAVLISWLYDRDNEIWFRAPYDPIRHRSSSWRRHTHVSSADAYILAAHLEALEMQASLKAEG